MTRELLRAFLDKSGLPLSYIGRQTNVNRTELSYQLHGHRDLTDEKSQRVKNFIEDYAKRWKE